jgi:hypothetical protein
LNDEDFSDDTWSANRRAGGVEAMIIRISAPSKTIEVDDAVQRFGWIDQANHAIRAHIEYAPSRPDRQPSSPNAI